MNVTFIYSGSDGIPHPSRVLHSQMKTDEESFLLSHLLLREAPSGYQVARPLPSVRLLQPHLRHLLEPHGRGPASQPHHGRLLQAHHGHAFDEGLGFGRGRVQRLLGGTVRVALEQVVD